MIHELQVKIHHVAHGIKPRWARRAAKPRMSWEVEIIPLSQHVVIVQPARIASGSMQQQQRAPCPAADQIHLSAAQLDKFFAKFPHVASLYQSQITSVESEQDPFLTMPITNVP